jgi:hypothetical protein
MVTDKDFATGLPNNVDPGSPATDPDTKTSYTNRDDILTATERKHFLAWYNYLRIGENQSEGFKPASEYTDDTVVSETNTVATTSPNLNTSAPANTKPRGSGWDLAAGQNYSNISCFDNSSGTITTHPLIKATFRYCDVGSVTGVNSMISANINQLLIDAKNSGLALSGSGYRSFAVQQALRIQHGCANLSRPAESCRPPTARPGQSMHERGLAIDFSKCGSRSTACYQWLNKNASKYGLINLPSEPWHWSVSGH